MEKLLMLLSLVLCFSVSAALIPVLFYKRYERLEPEIHAELNRRHAAQAN